VTFADEANYLHPEFQTHPFVRLNLDQDDYPDVEPHDLVICSNVLEHLADPRGFLRKSCSLIAPGGHLYLSWTNWLSPWGGHEF
jgi:2-polyprenyl-3-methyl-5-hydroxy-6-metoxy-1,4-benzoquinol methylase